MPYRRGYKGRGKKKFRLGKKLAKRGSIYGTAAQQLWKDVGWLKSVINVEKKVFDSASNGQQPSNTGAIYWLSGITTGTGFNQRTGMVVKASNISMRLNCNVNASATSSTFSQLRVILFINKSLNHGQTPAVADILQSLNTPMSPYNLDNVGDFEVLYDRKLDLTLQYPSKSINIFRRLHHHIRWDTSGDLITDTEKGHIFMLLLSDEGAAFPAVDYYVRLRYVDN